MNPYYSHQGDDDQADVKKTKMGGKSKGGVRLSTDPQSVAARERRHRISHRLKTLQSMVPGASKLDTVSLLDHAIHYVHFLNSQIRFHQLLLLSNNSTYSDVAPDPFLRLPNPPPPPSDYDRYFGVVDASAAAHAALPPPREVDAGAFEEDGCFWFDVIQGVGVRSGGSTLDF